MTLTSLLPHRVHRGRVVSNVAVVALPTLVFTNMFTVDQHGGRLDVHDIGSGTYTRCRINLSRLAVVTAAEIRLREPWWCTGCWSTERYCRCGAPSGQATECTLCDRVDLDAEKRIEAAS